MGLLFALKRVCSMKVHTSSFIIYAVINYALESHPWWLRDIMLDWRPDLILGVLWSLVQCSQTLFIVIAIWHSCPSGFKHILRNCPSCDIYWYHSVTSVHGHSWETFMCGHSRFSNRSLFDKFRQNVVNVTKKADQILLQNTWIPFLTELLSFYYLSYNISYQISTNKSDCGLKTFRSSLHVSEFLF